MCQFRILRIKKLAIGQSKVAIKAIPTNHELAISNANPSVVSVHHSGNSKLYTLIGT